MTIPAIAALLNNVPTLWAVPLAAYIGKINYDLGNFCTTDPPPVPSFTAQDALDLLDVQNIFAFHAAASKFQQLVGAYAWYQLCECTSVATPAPPTPPAAPPGLVQIDPPISGGTSPQPCWSKTITIPNRPNGVTVDITAQLMPAIGVSGRALMPDPWYKIQVCRQANTDGSSNGYWNGNMHFVNSSGTQTSVWGIGAGVGVKTCDFPTPTATMGTNGSIYITDDGGQTGANNTVTVTVNLFNCPGVPPFNQSPCCPPDQIAAGVLQRVLDTVTLIQRQIAPFAYVPGAVHAALTGSGELTVSGLIGAKIAPSAIPSSIGRVAGDPDTLWLDSWITWGNNDGWTAREFLTHSPYVSLPKLAGQWTKIGYTIRPGLTVTLTELRREP